MKKNILKHFKLDELYIHNLKNDNDDFVEIEPYQISCLYGGDRLSINFIYMLNQLHLQQFSIYKITLNKIGLFSYKLKILRILYYITNFKYIRKNKHRIKLKKYVDELMKILQK